MAKKRKPSSRSSRSRTPSHPSARSSRSRTPSHPSSGARTSSLPSRERSGTGDQQQPTATQAEPAQQGGDAAQGRMAKKGEKQRTPTSRQSASRTPSHHSSGAHTTSVRSGERSGSADEQRSGTQAKAMPIFPELAMARANTHPPTTRTSATRKAFDMYRSCVHAHEVARIHDEESSLKRFMGEHQLVVSSKDYNIDTVDLLVDLAVNWHLPFLFHLAPHWDNATGSLMLIVYPGSLGRYFTVSEQTRAAFPEYMRIHLSRGFANDTDFATLFRDFREWVEAATKVLHEPITDSDYPWLKFPFSGLGAYAENVDADAFLASVNRHYEKYALYGGRQRIQFSSGSTVFFTDKRVLMALDALLSNHSFTIPVSSYVAWKFLELFGWALDNKIAEIRFGETEKLLLLKARRVACANFVERTYGFAMTARYLMEKVDTQIRDTILGLLTRTQEAMLRLVARAPWMDARSRELFKLKVLQQKRYIWMSYQATYTNVLDNLYFDFPDMTENFVANWISSSKVLARKLLLNTSMDYIGRTDPALVRYLYHQNAQLIPMSLVFKPMYVPDGTPAINYAGLGAVYSQLLMQLFDTVGVLFNHNNDFVSWMTAPTLASHRVILQCLFKEQPQRAFERHNMLLARRSSLMRTQVSVHDTTGLAVLQKSGFAVMLTSMTALGLATTAHSHVTYKIGMTLPPDNRAYTAHSDWAEMAYFHARYLEATITNRTELPPVAVQWINGSDDVDICELRSSGMVALISAEECSATAALAAKARRANLPFLALHTIGCSREDVLFPREAGKGTGGTAQKAHDQELWTEKEDPGMFFVTHLDAMDIQVILQKLATMQVYRALVVYDEEFAIHGLGPLKEKAESHNFTLSFVPLEANRTRVKEVINETLWRLKQINSYFTSFAMLLFSSFTIADRLEAELIDEEVLDPSMRTLAFYSGFDLGLSRWYKQYHNRCPYEKVIYVILRRFHEKARKLLITAAAQRNSEDKALSFADCFAVVFLNAIMEYMSSARLPETTDCGTAMDDFLEGMKKNLTSEMKMLRMHRSTIRYYTFYLAPVRSKVYRLKHVDTWKQKDGRLERTIVMTEVEAYLKNREIKVALQEYPPYVVYEKSPTGETTVNGTLPILLDYIQQKFKFRASYQLLENVTTAGIRLDEYNWTGALGMLNQRETDMVTFLDFTEARSKSFTLTAPLTSHPVVIIVQTPRIMYRQWLFMQPFTTQVWLLIVASVPVVSVALWLVYNRCPEEAVRLRKVRGFSRLQNCAWYLYGALLQQGGVHLPVGTSSRLVVGAWWIYVVLVMSCYSSTLVAFLSVPVPRWVVTSFREALQREDVHIYLPGGTGVEDMVRKSMNEEIVDLRKRLERGHGASIMNVVSDALDPVAAGKGILIGDVMYLRALVMADHRKHGYKKCRITILNDVAFDITITIGTRKGSPFIQALDDVLMKLRTTGNHHYMLTDHQEKQHPCIHDYDAEVGVLTKPIGLSELESAFLLLLLGTAASSMLVPIEFVAHWARTRFRARKLTSPTPAVTWPALSRAKGRRYISLQHGWKRANDCIWTTVGPGGHVLTDTYPAFGRFGRRPLYLKEAPSFPFYEGCRPSRVRVNDALSSQVGLEMQKGHIVIVGAWP